MPSTVPDVASNITIAAGTSGFSAEKVSFTPPQTSVDEIDTSHLGMTAGSGKTYMPADLLENGSLEIGEMHFNPDTTPPVRTQETWTITWPSGATWVFSGFMAEYTPGEMAINQKMVGAARIKVSGNITITP